MVVATFRWQPGKAATVTQAELLLLMTCYCFLACILKSCEIFSVSRMRKSDPPEDSSLKKKKKKGRKIKPMSKP